MNYTNFKLNYCMPSTYPLVCLVIGPSVRPSVCLSTPLAQPAQLCWLLLSRGPGKQDDRHSSANVASRRSLTPSPLTNSPSIFLPCFKLALFYGNNSPFHVCFMPPPLSPRARFLILFLFRSRRLIKCSEKSWWLNIMRYFLPLPLGLRKAHKVPVGIFVLDIL